MPSSRAEAGVPWEAYCLTGCGSSCYSSSSVQSSLVSETRHVAALDIESDMPYLGTHV